MEPFIVVAVFFVCYFLVVYGFYLRRKRLEKQEARLNTKSYVEDLFEIQDLMGQNESANGMIPKGEGPFGLCKENPIPVKGVLGEISYLSRLRTMEDIKIQYVRKGSTRAHNINHPVDIYEIAIDNEAICILYLCPYYKDISSIAPEGFDLIT